MWQCYSCFRDSTGVGAHHGHGGRDAKRRDRRKLYEYVKSLVTTSKNHEGWGGDRTLGTYEGQRRPTKTSRARPRPTWRCVAWGFTDDPGKAPNDRGTGRAPSATTTAMRSWRRMNARPPRAGPRRWWRGLESSRAFSGTGEWTVVKFPLKEGDKLSRGDRQRKSALENHFEYDAGREARIVHPWVSDDPRRRSAPQRKASRTALEAGYSARIRTANTVLLITK